MSEFYVYPEDLSDSEVPVIVGASTKTKNTVKNTVYVKAITKK